LPKNKIVLKSDYRLTGHPPLKRTLKLLHVKYRAWVKEKIKPADGAKKKA